MRRTLRCLGVGLVVAAACDPRTETEVVQSPLTLTCAGDSDCNDGNPCTDDACDLGAHLCRQFNNNLSCSDGNACTTNDVCSSGACLGGDVAASCSPCSAAVTIPSGGGTFTGTVQGSSFLRGSCDTAGGSPERVYAWTPTATGTATLQTCGGNTNYDTVVYVLSSIGGPGTCTASGERACNDDTIGCGVNDGFARAHGSRLNVSVTAGQTYYIVVDGWGGRRGAYTLTVSPPSRCGNNVREGAEVCDGTDSSACPTGMCKTDCTCQAPASGLPDLVGAISNVQVQRNASVAPADVAEGCASAMTGLTLLRFSANTSNVGTADLVLGNPQCPDCSLSSNWNMTCGNSAFECSGASGHDHAHYSNYARYELLDGTGTLLRTGHKQGFCLRDSQCTSGTAKYDCDNQGVSAGCSDFYGISLGCQYIDITGVPNGAYTLRMIVDPFNQIPELDDTSNNTVTMPITLAGMAPAPEVVPAIGGTFAGSTSGSSFYSGACAAGPTSGTPEHVFVWTPNASGSATISTCSPSTRFDTVMYVSTNTNGSSPLACEDDTPGCAVNDGSTYSANHGSRITLNVTAGTAYYIFLDSYAGSAGATSGQYSLTIVPPSGAGGSPGPDGGADGGSGILVIPSTGGSVTGTTSGSSGSSGTCATAATSTAPEVIYQFTPTRTGTATFQTCSTMTLFDTVLYVKTAATGGSELACGDDAIGCPTGDPSTRQGVHGSRFNLRVAAGTTYYVVVDGYGGSAGGSQGQFVLTVTPPP